MSNEFKLEMADVVKAHLDVPGCPVLTSNQCHAIATKLNALLAAAPQPPALGGEPEVIHQYLSKGECARWHSLCESQLIEATQQGFVTRQLIDRAHLAPLQAEIEDYKAGQNRYEKLCEDQRTEISQLKAQRDELEKNDRRYEWIRSQGTKWSELSPALLERVNDECNPPYMALKFGEELDSAIDACISRAALSKPAGSEKV